MPVETAIVTGANGFIGAHLVRILLGRGWVVHALGRGRDGVRWPERVAAAIHAAVPAVDLSDAGRWNCHEADLARPDLGLREPPDGFGRQPAVLVHLAGDTRFAPSDPAAQRRTNVEGTLNVVRTLRPFVSRMVHVSTAFVAGNSTGIILENETDVGQGFHNPYEKTKLAAETGVRRLCAELRLPLAVARPSIIVNDTVTGRSSAFTHLNVMVEVANRIQEFYGIKDGEVVNREIRVPVNPAARPNAAAVDPVAEAMAALAASSDTAGKTFHLCHPAPQSNPEVLGLILEAFGIREKIRLRFTEHLSRPLTRTEEMFARAFKIYLPYLNQDRVFDLANTRAAIPDYDARFQPMDLDYLRKVIAFERRERGRKALR